jgi:nucleotide-binding universal stress UspA family protein
MQLLALKTVLIAVDLEDTSPRAIEAAAHLAQGAGATLHAVHVTSSVANDDDNIDATVEMRRSLVAALHRGGGTIALDHVHVRQGNPADVIGSLAIDIRADVIVLGPRRSDWHVRSPDERAGTAHSIVTSAGIPCLIVSHPLVLPIERVLVPVDRSATAREALRLGLTWASALRGRGGAALLKALHVDVLSDPDTSARESALSAELEIVRSTAGSWAGVSIEGVTTHGADVAKAVEEFAAGFRPGLVVLATRGHCLDDANRLGSVASQVLSKLNVPVLLVPPAMALDVVSESV